MLWIVHGYKILLLLMNKNIIPVLFFLVLFFPYQIHAQTTCATIQEVNVSTTEITSKTPFNCDVVVDSTHANSKTIACGISFNDGFPLDFCPSDQFFGGWQGNTAKFNCLIPNTNIPSTITSIKLIGYDFSPECGPSTGKAIPLMFKKTTSSTPSTTTSVEKPEDQVDTLRSIMNILFGFGEYTTTTENTTSTATSQPLQNTTTISSIPLPPIQNITSMSELLSKTNNTNYSADLQNQLRPCLAHKQVYEEAAKYTGVPWQVLAGIHYREGSCGSNQSLVSGRTIGTNEPDLHGNCTSLRAGVGIPKPLVGGGCGFDNLLSTAIYAGNHLKGKIGKNPETFAELTNALSWYNGGGNANCGKTPYSSCPRSHIGEDDTYVMNLFDSRHTPMYIVYCADYTVCNPPVRDLRPGTGTAAKIMAGM
jgi:hypothetical protein